MAHSPRRHAARLSLVFFFSGFASLLYQVAWQRALTLHYGVASVSIVLIVSIYMLGLGAGSLLGGWLAERLRRPAIGFLVAQALIGVFGFISVPLLDFLGARTAGAQRLAAAFYTLLFLCAPTVLMGVTLPLITKVYSRLHDFASAISLLYFVNTLGAAAGALVASYVVISLLGMDAAVYVAATINLLLAAAVLSSARGASAALASLPSTDTAAAQNSPRSAVNWAPCLFVFVTGFLAIGYEIIWFRVIGVLVKDSPYAFSSVLAVYLLGVALGSLFMNRYLRQQEVDRRSAFFLMQALIALYVFVSVAGYYYLTRYTPLGALTRLSFAHLAHPSFPPISLTGSVWASLFITIDVFFWSALFVLPPTVLMGATFPLVSALALKRQDHEGSTVGWVSFCNIMGNVCGGLGVGFALLPWLGSERVLALFVCVGACFALGAAIVRGRPQPLARRIAFALALCLATVLLFPAATGLYKAIHTPPGPDFETLIEEGADTVVVTYRKGDHLATYIGGAPHGWRPVYLYHYETAEAFAYAPKAERVFVLGYGNGTVPEVALKSPEVAKVVAVEISHSVIRNLRKIDFFEPLLNDPRLDLVVADGRHHLLHDKTTYDIILIDPLRTRTSHSNNLYSHEFLSVIRDRLNPGGVFMVWIDEYRVMPKTILSVFPHVRQYKFNTPGGGGFCVASTQPLQRSQDRYLRLVDTFTPQERQGMIDCGGHFVADSARIEQRGRGLPINRDWKPVCEFYLGLRIREALHGVSTAEAAP